MLYVYCKKLIEKCCILYMKSIYHLHYYHVVMDQWIYLSSGLEPLVRRTSTEKYDDAELRNLQFIITASTSPTLKHHDCCCIISNGTNLQENGLF